MEGQKEKFNGLVMRSTGSWYEVLNDSNEKIECRLRGKFKLNGKNITNPIAVGDYVMFEYESEDKGLITDILLRQNYIMRKSVHRKHEGHILAANLDQAILIVTLVFPRTSLGFIDRFLITTESFRIPTVIVFNKIDLLDKDGIEYLNELIALYSSIGYKCLQTSTIENFNIDIFHLQLKYKKSLVAGHSGVGKSSLVNSINPHLDIRTSEVSTFANKGVHTTTFAEMFELEPGTFIIDSPGIKELGLADMEPWEISHYFPEMRLLLNNCKYHNCTHVHEPGCAVITAVENNIIAQSRYINYLSMIENDDNRR